MRSINKLLKISIKNFNLIQDDYQGLCFLPEILSNLRQIKKRENLRLFRFIQYNKPSNKINKSFTLHPSFTNYTYWWNRDVQGYDQRLKFLEFLEYKTRPWYKKLWWI